MTTIVPNRSSVTGTVTAVRGDVVELRVETSSAAWPDVADLAADRIGQTLAVVTSGGAAASLRSGTKVEVECGLEPTGASGVAFVAYSIATSPSGGG